MVGFLNLLAEVFLLNLMISKIISLSISLR
nr:MAG TPA: hypothetical protein [Caudoviricetes sp.]